MSQPTISCVTLQCKIINLTQYSCQNEGWAGEVLVHITPLVTIYHRVTLLSFANVYKTAKYPSLKLYE